MPQARLLRHGGTLLLRSVGVWAASPAGATCSGDVLAGRLPQTHTSSCRGAAYQGT